MQASQGMLGRKCRQLCNVGNTPVPNATKPKQVVLWPQVPRSRSNFRHAIKPSLCPWKCSDFFVVVSWVFAWNVQGSLKEKSFGIRDLQVVCFLLIFSKLLLQVQQVSPSYPLGLPTFLGRSMVGCPPSFQVKGPKWPLPCTSCIHHVWSDTRRQTLFQTDSKWAIATSCIQHGWWDTQSQSQHHKAPLSLSLCCLELTRTRSKVVLSISVSLHLYMTHS